MPQKNFTSLKVEFIGMFHETRADTAKTMAYSDSCRESRKLQTVNTVLYCQDRFRQGQTVKKTADNFRPLNTCLFFIFYIQLDGDFPPKIVAT